MKDQSQAEWIIQVFEGFRSSSHRDSDGTPIHLAVVAELRRLLADRDSWERQASDRTDDAVQFARERDEARAERDALRARLEVTPQGPDGIDARDETIRVLEGERDKLRADAERLDSGMIKLSGRDEFGDSQTVVHIGVNLRDAIDAARGKGKA